MTETIIKKAMKDNPDLPRKFVVDALESMNEAKQGKLTKRG